jgi:hypothetical protein
VTAGSGRCERGQLDGIPQALAHGEIRDVWQCDQSHHGVANEQLERTVSGAGHGDLNAAPDSALLRPLLEVLIDAWSVGGGDPCAVTLPSSHPSASLEAGPAE